MVSSNTSYSKTKKANITRKMPTTKTKKGIDCIERTCKDNMDGICQRFKNGDEFLDANKRGAHCAISWIHGFGSPPKGMSSESLIQQIQDKAEPRHIPMRRGIFRGKPLKYPKDYVIPVPKLLGLLQNLTQQIKDKIKYYKNEANPALSESYTWHLDVARSLEWVLALVGDSSEEAEQK